MKILLCTVLLLAPTLSFSQVFVTIRVCTYNVLNLGTDKDDSLRADKFKLIFEEIKPDILAVQELRGAGSLDLVRTAFSEAMSNSNIIAYTYYDSPDSDFGVLYDSTQFTVEAFEAIESIPRYIGAYTFSRKDIFDTLVVYVGHFKAGQDEEDEEQRFSTVGDIREHTRALPRHYSFLLAGDLNTYSWTEKAYNLLIVEIASLNDHFVDPINRPGDWHNNSDFADIHTQSPRVRQFDGGVHGGMDDRFDHIMISSNLTDNYVSSSYITFGNDGNHFNDSINAMPNTAVSQEIAQALHDASDHLPVYLDLRFGKRMTMSVEEDKQWVEGLLDLW